MAVNGSEYYNVGYGRSTPDVGYGEAQVLGQNDIVGAGIDAMKSAYAVSSDMAEKRKKAPPRPKPSLENPYTQPYARALYEKKRTEVEEDIEALDPTSPTFKQDIEILTKGLETIRGALNPREDAWLEGLSEPDAEAYEFSEPLDFGRKGRAYDVDVDDYDLTTAEGLQQYYVDMDKANARVKKPTPINYEQTANEILSGVAGTVYDNPDFVTNYDEVKALNGDINRIRQIARLTPEGEAVLHGAIANDPELAKQAERDYKAGNGVMEGETFAEYKERRERGQLPVFMAKSKTDVRSTPKDKKGKEEKEPTVFTPAKKERVSDGVVEDVNFFDIPNSIKDKVVFEGKVNETDEFKVKMQPQRVFKNKDGVTMVEVSYDVATDSKKEEGDVKSFRKPKEVPLDEMLSLIENNLSPEDKKALLDAADKLPRARTKGLSKDDILADLNEYEHGKMGYSTEAQIDKVKQWVAKVGGEVTDIDTYGDDVVFSLPDENGEMKSYTFELDDKDAKEQMAEVLDKAFKLKKAQALIDEASE